METSEPGATRAIAMLTGQNTPPHIDHQQCTSIT
jgi:hypothetical protein